MKRPRIDVNLSALDQLLDQAQQAPLSEPDCNKIKTTLQRGPMPGQRKGPCRIPV